MSILPVANKGILGICNYACLMVLVLTIYLCYRRWEGFAHIVLHCWLENEQPGRSSGSVKSEVEEQAPLLALLLHVAIRLLSDSDHTLRMVCMVAENLPSSNNSCVTAVSNSIRSSHGSPTVSNSIRSIQQLHDILSKIDKKCNFDEALRSIKLT